jgi:antitoxin (DNA-binding transcriptional repressor) of toxin-antitoxin stability system
MASRGSRTQTSSRAKKRPTGQKIGNRSRGCGLSEITGRGGILVRAEGDLGVPDEVILSGAPLDKVAIGSYFAVMRRVITVGVRELKNRLSEYLGDVKAGAVILVSKRAHLIAEIRQPRFADQAQPADSPINDWTREGTLILPRARKSRCPKSPVSLPAGTARQLLSRDRGE